MKLEQLTVHLRLRSSWEAIELGMALVRRDAAAVYVPWLLVTVPILLLANAAAWALDRFFLATLLMWWLKPLFDRIPLFVISRAVFGATPGTRETLAAQLRWGWRPMLHYLSWRRFSPVRSLYLPVDFLEGVDGARLRERRRVLGGGVYGHAMVLTLLCLAFQAALVLGAIFAVLLYFPIELLPETLRSAWAVLAEQSPPWARLALNLLIWAAVTVIEPLFVGAGFGLYLNRRTELEAWDVEIVFRKLRQRVAAGAGSALLLLVGVLGLHAGQAHAQDEEADPGEDVSYPLADKLPDVFGDQLVDDQRFRKSAGQAQQDPDLNREHVQKNWERKTREKQTAEPVQRDWTWLRWLGGVFAFAGEWGLWILAGVLVILLLSTLPRWLPWMRGLHAPRVRVDADVSSTAITLPEMLPEDVAASARRLWREGQRRQALALLYRAGVVALARRLQTTLPPGATEAECLRASRKLAQAEDRQLFAQVVRVWQYAAYAQRDPDDGEFEALLTQLQQRGGWLA